MRCVRRMRSVRVEIGMSGGGGGRCRSFGCGWFVGWFGGWGQGGWAVGGAVAVVAVTIAIAGTGAAGGGGTMAEGRGEVGCWGRHLV